MILCPNCQHKEIAGAVFCSNCGTQLMSSSSKTHKIHTAETSLPDKTSKPLRAAPKVQLVSWASLHIVQSGQIISLADRDEFTLGRVSEGQPIMPDVDLTSYDAYACGVSRLHCVIKRVKQIAFVMDLGSSNGTFLNGRKIPPHSQVPIKHTDLLALGKLKIQILINHPSQ